ncbi:TrbG/VirB9 family P-type conjugative transfer protein, partial [Achromobacter sp.]|uniref:TrbG/VirB9 family P-type conjugative transfer protein n=1 Tax=Achromobacter sp. TaxID=134375 RepID=UPI002F95A2A1
MVRFFFVAAGLSCLGACTGAGKSPAASPWEASRQAAQGFRFDWQLSGDPAVAPMQVFDDGKETWLQFAPGQALPAIFGIGSDGERALPYSRRDPYVVLAGGWNGLLFRGGRLTARAQRLPAVADARAAAGTGAR